jgi:hypothetical protein
MKARDADSGGAQPPSGGSGDSVTRGGEASYSKGDPPADEEGYQSPDSGAGDPPQGGGWGGGAADPPAGDHTTLSDF